MDILHRFLGLQRIRKTFWHPRRVLHGAARLATLVKPRHQTGLVVMSWHDPGGKKNWGNLVKFTKNPMDHVRKAQQFDQTRLLSTFQGNLCEILGVVQRFPVVFGG